MPIFLCYIYYANFDSHIIGYLCVAYSESWYFLEGFASMMPFLQFINLNDFDVIRIKGGSFCPTDQMGL